MFHMGAVTEVFRYFSVPMIMYFLLFSYGAGMVFAECEPKRRVAVIVSCFLLIAAVFVPSAKGTWLRAYYVQEPAAKGAIETHAKDTSGRIREVCGPEDRILIVDCYDIENESMFYHAYTYYCLPIYNKAILVNPAADLNLTPGELEAQVRAGRINKVVLINPTKALKDALSGVLSLDPQSEMNIFGVDVDGAKIHYTPVAF